MLEKPEHLNITDDDPWGKDKLARRIEAINLTTLVRTLTQPFVISITSPWGTGKTTFIKMWKAQLKAENQPCIYFNAWENDFSENPFISFISEIGSYLETGHIDSIPAKDKYSELKAKGKSIFQKAVPIALKIATRGAIGSADELSDIFSFDPEDENDVANFLSKLLESEINDYNNKKDSIASFKESLAGFASELVNQEDVNGPLVIFIDELDRCRPDFALKLLENIKHIFDVPNIVFILAVDKDQLRNSVKTLYGQGMNADGYLRRFIDLEYQLKKPDFHRYSQFLTSIFNFAEIPIWQQFDTNRFIMSFSYLSDIFNLSLRDQEQCFSVLNIILRTTITEREINYFILLFIVTLKMHNEELYNEFNLKKCNPQKILNLFDEAVIREKYSTIDSYLAYLEYFLFAYLSSDGEFKHYINACQKNYEKAHAEDDAEQFKYTKILRLHNNASKETVVNHIVPDQIRLLEFSNRFNVN